MESPRFAIENVLLHLSEHFTYLNSGEDKGVRIIEGLLYSIKRLGMDEHLLKSSYQTLYFELLTNLPP